MSQENVKPGLWVSLFCKRRTFIDCVSEEENSPGILPYVTSSNKKDGENCRSLLWQLKWLVRVSKCTQSKG